MDFETFVKIFTQYPTAHVQFKPLTNKKSIRTQENAVKHVPVLEFDIDNNYTNTTPKLDENGQILLDSKGSPLLEKLPDDKQPRLYIKDIRAVIEKLGICAIIYPTKNYKRRKHDDDPGMPERTRLVIPLTNSSAFQQINPKIIIEDTYTYTEKGKDKSITYKRLDNNIFGIMYLAAADKLGLPDPDNCLDPACFKTSQHFNRSPDLEFKPDINIRQADIKKGIAEGDYIAPIVIEGKILNLLELIPNFVELLNDPEYIKGMEARIEIARSKDKQKSNPRKQPSLLDTKPTNNTPKTAKSTPTPTPNTKPTPRPQRKQCRPQTTKPC
ncbi:hypothetical protein NHP22001_13450 [Helicobacter sp. NHP22-001]|nr:hypothetical protein NHP22001_13450 [Helicobacter sp. NHP22-001]